MEDVLKINVIYNIPSLTKIKIPENLILVTSLNTDYNIY